MWVKICANTTLEDAQFAVEAGADAVGFVFAPSPRRVTVEQVAAITCHLPAATEKIGVFVDANFEEISSAVIHCSLTGVQLHAQTEASAKSALAARLRGDFGPSLRILRVVHFTPDITNEIELIRNEASFDAILVDSRTAAAVGGTGTTFDWNAAKESLFAIERNLKLIAAGGLTPLNVAEAIRLLAPWGVDVASGVEERPGRKDAAKVRAFVRNARSAAR